MNKSRRNFLQIGSMLGLATVMTGGLNAIAFGRSSKNAGNGFSIPMQILADPLMGITLEMWSQSINSKFTVGLRGVQLTSMTLIAVQDLNPPSAKGTGKECFSLVFSGPSDLALRQDTYTLQNSR